MASDLYTSQVHLKRLLAGQATAAFTPLSVDVAKLIDPAFVPGMGALNEDEKGRLQCPIRGCGQYHSKLAFHIARAHPTIGTAGVRVALSIPKRRPLMSQSVRAKAFSAYSRAAKDRIANYAHRSPGHPRGIGTPPSIMSDNERDVCSAQIQSRIDDLHHRLGRNVTADDFRRAFGDRTFGRVIHLFATWNNAKAVCGLHATRQEHPPKRDMNLVLESLRTWIAVHGDLPSSYDASRPTRAPMIPPTTTIKRAFGVDTWQAAMRSAAEQLGIDSERYGKCSHRRKSALWRVVNIPTVDIAPL